MFEILVEILMLPLKNDAHYLDKSTGTYCEFSCGTVIGCHLCNKLVCGISSLLDIPWSTVSGNIGKWKCLETVAGSPSAKAHGE